MGGGAILSQNVTGVADNTGKQVNIYGRLSNNNVTECYRCYR